MIKLSRGTRTRIRALFPERDWSTVEELLETECGDNLPFVEPSFKRLAERIRFAVLKLSQGDMARLEYEIKEAHIDWRDTLVAAGFGYDLSAHKKWKPAPRSRT